MPTSENFLIRRLPRTARKHLLDQCALFDLVLSDELSVRGQPLGHAHFPIDGFISMVIDMDNYPELDVGMVGCESMLGAELLLGVTPAPWRALVQGPGHSWRIGAKALRRECATSPALLQAVQTSLLVRLHQQALASACERFHMIGQRLARWLLMSHDRARSDHFHVTHEGMATMLGVRRVGVTLAASELQDSGLIRYHRGELTVLDRIALEARACSCYATDRALHQTLFPAQPA